MKIHEIYIKRCIELAKNGLGTTYPNPLVGSVIVCDGKIIGEGWHRKAGEPHAEVHAIQSVKDKALLEKSTIYVSLEPCSHFGKTPPCSNLIIQSKIPNVVIGTIDPFSKVAGNGVKMLMEAGINVAIGVLEDECNELNKRFFSFHTKQRPFIILKWAQTSDGFLAPKSKDEKKPVWITNQYSRQLVHKWRTEEQAILIGKNTVLEDNPSLTARDWQGNNPVRIVLDKNYKISKEFVIFDNSAPTILLGINEIDYKKNVVEQVCTLLFERGIQSVIIEGGSHTLQAFIESGLWDEARVFTCDVVFKDGVKAPSLNGNVKNSKTILNDQLIIYSNYG